MAYEDIYARYNKLYASQNNALLQKKNTAVTGYNNQTNDTNNQYATIANNLKNKLTQAKSNYTQQQGDVNSKYNNLYSTYNNQQADNTTKFKNLYTGLDNQRVVAKDTKYTDSNAVDTGINQNLNRVQEIMAKNGWSGGGENLQAQLNSNSDRSNGQGKVTQDFNKDMLGIATTQQGYQGQEAGINNDIATSRTNSQADQVSDLGSLLSGYNTNAADINGQMSSSAAEQKTKIQAIMDAINAANSGYGADSSALRSQLDSEAGTEVAQVQAVEKQRVYEAQQLVKQQQYEAQQQAIQRAYEKQQSDIAYSRQVASAAASARTASAKASASSAKKAAAAAQPTSGVNTKITDINSIVNGNDYSISEKQRILTNYANDLKTQTGTNAKYLITYVAQAQAKVKQEMSDFVNAGRYAGMENRRDM